MSQSDREPDPTTRRFVDEAAVRATRDGLEAALEVTAFPDGSVYVRSSRIVPERGKRLIVPDSALMFGDLEEAKDAIGLILDRLRGEDASRSSENSSADSASPTGARTEGNTAPQPDRDDLTRALAHLECGPPADEKALAELVRHVSATYGTGLPGDYLAFLRTADGADGRLESGTPVVFWTAERVAQVTSDLDAAGRMPGLLVIGGDTGDYVYGIDLRAEAPAGRYVETEDVAMAWDDVLWRGASLLDLLAHADRAEIMVPRERGRGGAVRTIGRRLRRRS